MSFDTYQGPFASAAFVEAALAPYAIGWLISLIVYGVCLSHLMVYFDSSHYSSDSIKTKLIVTISIILASIQNGETVWNLHHRGTWQGRDAQQMVSKTLLDCLNTLAVGFEAVLVQYFLSEQASAFFETRKSKIIFSVTSAVGMLTSLAGFILAIVLSFTSRAGALDNFTLNRLTGIYQLGGAWVNLASIIPLMILLTRKFSEFNSNTENGSRHLVYFSIIALGSLLLSSVVGAALCYVFDPSSQFANISAIFWNPLSSLYLLATLTTLTARTPIARPIERKFANTGISVAISFVQHVDAEREGGSISGIHGINSVTTRKYRKPVGVTFDGIGTATQDELIEKDGNLGTVFEAV